MELGRLFMPMAASIPASSKTMYITDADRLRRKTSHDMSANLKMDYTTAKVLIVGLMEIVMLEILRKTGCLDTAPLPGKMGSSTQESLKKI